MILNNIKNEIKIYLDVLLKKYNYSFNGKYHIHSIGDLKLTSVTKFISETKEPFDEDAIIDKIINDENSNYYRLEPDFIKSQWNRLRRLGTEAHKKVELWLKELINDDEFAYSDFFIKNDIKPENCLSEVPVFNKLYRLGGTIDIIKLEEYDNEIVLYVYDVKTSGGISGNNEKMTTACQQIHVYSLLLDVLMKNFKYKKPISVKRGRIISIESNIENIRIPIDIHNLNQFKPPVLLNTINETNIYNDIKNKLLERKNGI